MFAHEDARRVLRVAEEAVQSLCRWETPELVHLNDPDLADVGRGFWQLCNQCLLSVLCVFFGIQRPSISEVRNCCADCGEMWSFPESLRCNCPIQSQTRHPVETTLIPASSLVERVIQPTTDFVFEGTVLFQNDTCIWPTHYLLSQEGFPREVVCPDIVLFSWQRRRSCILQNERAIFEEGPCYSFCGRACRWSL